MLKPLILRADTGNVSGYKQLIEKTIKVLSKHYDLIVLPVFYEKNNCEGYKKINKKNWNCPELYLSPMSNDEHLSFLGDFTVKNNCFLYTMWESSRLTRYQKKECLPFSKILVPSKWNKECFDREGFNVETLPCFVDEDVYYEKTKKVFVYGPEVDDFHTLDKPYISLMCVGGIQELSKQNELLKQEITLLKEQMKNILNLLNASC